MYLHGTASEIDFGVCINKKPNHNCKCFHVLTFIQYFHVVPFKSDSFPSPKLIKICPFRTVPHFKKKNLTIVPWCVLIDLLVGAYSGNTFLPSARTEDQKLHSSSGKASSGCRQRSFSRKKHSKYWWCIPFWRCPELQHESMHIVWLPQPASEYFNYTLVFERPPWRFC